MAPLDEKEVNEGIAEGYSEMLFALPSEDRDTVLSKLDEIAALAEKIR